MIRDISRKCELKLFFSRFRRHCNWSRLGKNLFRKCACLSATALTFCHLSHSFFASHFRCYKLKFCFELGAKYAHFYRNRTALPTLMISLLFSLFYLSKEKMMHQWRHSYSRPNPHSNIPLF